MMGKKLLLLAVFIAVPLFAHAQDKESEHPIDVWTSQCMEKDGSTMGMIQCSDSAAVLWDIELNRVYKLLMDNLGEDAKSALREAQREWIKFRDKEFELISSYYTYIYEIMGGGTMYPMLAAGARAEVVRKRALALISLYDELNIHTGNSDDR